MPHIKPIDPATADAATAASLAAVKAKLGVVPNLILTLANTPVALNAYLQLSGATASGKLNVKQRESIALAVGQQNGCGYCLAAHTLLAGKAGLGAADIAAARAGTAANPRDAALLSLAVRVTETRGHLAPDELAAFKAQGLSDADVLEVITNVVVNILTNYVNDIAGTEVDFPAVPLKLAA